MATVGLGAKRFSSRGIEYYCLFGGEPLRQGFNLGSNSEEFIHVLSAVVVPASNLANGYLVFLGRSIEPRLLYLVDSHDIFARDIVKRLDVLKRGLFSR